MCGLFVLCAPEKEKAMGGRRTWSRVCMKTGRTSHEVAALHPVAWIEATHSHTQEQEKVNVYPLIHDK